MPLSRWRRAPPPSGSRRSAPEGGSTGARRRASKLDRQPADPGAARARIAEHGLVLLVGGVLDPGIGGEAPRGLPLRGQIDPQIAGVVAGREGGLVEVGPVPHVAGLAVESPGPGAHGQHQVGALLRPAQQRLAGVQVLGVEPGAVEAGGEDPALDSELGLDAPALGAADVDRREGHGVGVDQVALPGLEADQGEAPAVLFALDPRLPGLPGLGPEVGIAEEGEEQLAERWCAERLAIARPRPEAASQGDHRPGAEAGLPAVDVVVVVAQARVEAQRPRAPARLAERSPGALPGAVQVGAEAPRVGDLEALDLGAAGHPEAVAG